MNNATFKIYLRKDRKTVTGKYAVYFRITLNRKHRYYSLNLYCDQNQFNSKKEEFKIIYPNWDTYNRLILSRKSDLFNLISEANIKRKSLQLSDFDPIFKNPPVVQLSFYDFILRQIEVLNSRMSKGTIKNYKVELKKMQDFSKHLDFDRVNVFWLKSYEKHLAEKFKNKGITIHKSLRFIKCMINKAIEEGLIVETPFKKYKIGNPPNGDMEYLTKAEVLKLEKFYHNAPAGGSKTVLRYFLFSCYTGLRYQDLKNLTYENVVQRSYLYFRMQKTKKQIRIDLNNRAKKLLLFGRPQDNVFTVYTDQATNRTLKEIMKEVKIGKSISMHCARHTFATLASELGADTLQIKEILGHSNIQTTLIYTKVADSSKRKAMLLFDNM